MAITLAVGTQVAIASAYAASLPFTAATNAAETTLSMASTTGLAVGDFVEVTSAWGLMTGRVARVKTVTANTSIVLELVDTTNTSLYSGTAAGTVRRVSAWTQLSQLTSDISIGGGEQQYADVTTLDDRNQRQIPTTRSPLTAQFNCYFDPTLAWVVPVRAASDTAVPTAVRMVYPNGSRTVGNAYWSLQDVPTINDSTLRSSINLAFSAQPITYNT